MISAFGFAPEQGVLALQGGDGLDGVGAADGLRACFGEPEVAHFARVDQLLDGAGDVLDRHLRVDAVLVEQVDGVDPEPAQGPVDGVADVVGVAGQPGLAAVVVEGEAELGGDDDLVADGFEGSTDERLVAALAVGLGRVEEGDASLVGSAEQGGGIVGVQGLAPG